MDENENKRSKLATSNTRNVKRAKFSFTLSSALEIYNETAKRKIELLGRQIATSASHYLLEENVKALDEIEGISGEMYGRAINKFDNEMSRALFLKMLEHIRNDWLLNLK